MTTVVYLDDRRPKADDMRGRLPVTRFLNDLARDASELSNDWLFQMVDEPTKRRMLAERGLLVAEAA